MTDMEIPQAAIEAGAVAYWNDVKYADEMDWVDLDPDDAEVYRNTARVVLEAASPHLVAEVKVLTETASKVAYALGRKDALDEALWAIEDLRADMPGIATDHGRGWNGCVIASGHVIRNLASQPSQAASDATSGVPGHPEVGSETKAASNRLPRRVQCACDMTPPKPRRTAVQR